MSILNSEEPEILLYIGSLIAILWGMAHIVPTSIVVANFGDISDDNRRIITMEWIGSGLTLIFTGLLMLVMTVYGYADTPAAIVAYRMAALLLIARAILVSFTGARTPVKEMKLCPLIEAAAAILIFIGTLI